jgi:hypothetical protein
VFSFSPVDGQKIHSVYLAIFDLPKNLYTIQRKTMLLTTLVAGAGGSWRVTGITKEALEVLALNNYRYVKGKICRAHKVDRVETTRAVFEIPKPLSENEFFMVLWANDETVIATNLENKTGVTLPKESVIPIDYKLGLFPNSFIGFRYRKVEADYLRTLHATYKSKAGE